MKKLILVMSVCAAVGIGVADSVELHWLSDSVPVTEQGVSWGVPWPKGACKPDQSFALTSGNVSVPVASWPLAYWPDGSLKWSGHAAVVSSALPDQLVLSAGNPEKLKSALMVDESGSEIRIDTGSLSCTLEKSGGTLFQSLEIDGKKIGGGLRPVGYLQNAPAGQLLDVETKALNGRILKTELEQHNAVRAVVKIEGEYGGGFSKEWIIPFSARLYFYAGSSSVRIVQTLRYEGDEKQDFIKGLGLRMDVPLRENTLNRHILFAGESPGVWHEAVRLFSARSSRLEPNKDEILQRQLNSLPLEEPEAYGEKRAGILSQLAEWDGFRLVQRSSDSFDISKRTGAESCWVKSDAGGRARGSFFAGDTSGGIFWGLRDFWQSYPSSIEVNGMASDSAEVTVWFWPPDASAMDLRHYSTKAHGLQASYEDIEEGLSTPYGVARTFEMTLRALPTVPANDELSAMADAAVTPALPVCTPEYYHSLKVFGCWSLPDPSTPSKKWVEDGLATLLDYLEGEIDRRNWYGFWNYGDVMHQYDNVRHQWKYDIGGFAWANTELAPNLWLWYSFLRTGDATVFRMAEAMTRHTSEVDMYHSGPLRGLGTRHNVSHWGGGAKEVRISQALFHRPYYYLTADERIGDIIASVADNEQALVRLNPLRKVAGKSDWPTQARIGPDWFALAGNWFVAWERTGDVKYRERIEAGIKSILELPHGLFTGPYLNYDPASGEFGLVDGKATFEGSHMASVFGGAELMLELANEINNPAWTQAWSEFSERYNWSKAEWQKNGFQPPDRLGVFPSWHARLSAYSGVQQDSPELADRAWQEFLYTNREGHPDIPQPFSGTSVLNPGVEMSWGSINHMSQWSLNAIELLELALKRIPVNLGNEFPLE